MYETISVFLKTLSDKYGSRTALYARRLFRITKYSYAETYQLSLKVAAYVAKLGLSKGDFVIIWAPNMPEWVVTFLGCLTAGVTVIPVGIHSSKELVSKYITQTKPKLFFISKYFPIDITEDEYPSVKRVFLEEIENATKDLDINKRTIPKSDYLAEVVFTSGTTGEPKGVMITHHNILYQLEQLLKIVPHYKELRLLSVLPLSHVMEQVVGLFVPLARGGTVYYLPRVNALTIQKAIQKYHITDIGVVPQLLRMFLDTIEYQVSRDGREKLFRLMLFISSKLTFQIRRFIFRSIHKNLGGKLFVFGVGSAPLDVKVAQTWEAIGIKVVEGYGASETTGAVTANRVSFGLLGSVGKPLSGMKIQVSNEGEILVKGDNVTKGYLGDLKKTRSAFTKDGFYKTGDIGYFDKDGFLYITGRDKFKIVTSSGDKVYPEDIERKLNNHPAIWDSCVFGLRKDDGEIVYASLILKRGVKVEIDTVIKEVNGQLESHQQILEYSIWPHSDFPRLHTLKVDRTAVKTSLEKGYKSGEVHSSSNKNNGKEEDQLNNIISKVCKVDPTEIKEDSNLVLDFDLDSLKRVELVSLIEEEFGVEIEESLINKETTLRKLRHLIKNQTKTPQNYNLERIAQVIRSRTGRKMKVFLQDTILLPLFRIFVKTNTASDIDINKIKSPVVFIGNHPAPNDVLCLIQALPSRLREYLVAPGNDQHWKQKHFFMRDGDLLSLLGGGFPLNKEGGAVKKTLELIVDFLEDKYSLIILPEGAYTPDGKRLGPLRNGLEVLFSGTKTPLIPYFISGDLTNTFPLKGGFKHFFPHGNSNVILKIGKPFNLENISEERAMYTIRTKILELSE